MSASQVLGTEIYGFGKPGLIVGVYAERAIKKKSSLQLEMLFIQKGSRRVWKNDDGGTQTFNLNLNYIQLPVLFKTRLKGRFSFDIGLYFSVLMGDAKFTNENGNFPFDDPAARPFNRTEFGGLVGFNYRISDSFDFNMRYSNSILRVRAHQFGQTWRLNNGEYNSVLEITLRYVFRRTNEEKKAE